MFGIRVAFGWHPGVGDWVEVGAGVEAWVAGGAEGALPPLLLRLSGLHVVGASLRILSGDLMVLSLLLVVVLGPRTMIFSMSLVIVPVV